MIFVSCQIFLACPALWDFCHSATITPVQSHYDCLLPAEDPSESYVKLRDFVLSKLCQGLVSFAAEKLHRGFSEEMVKESQEKLKINKVTNERNISSNFQSYFTLNSFVYKKHLLSNIMATSFGLFCSVVRLSNLFSIVQ